MPSCVTHVLASCREELSGHTGIVPHPVQCIFSSLVAQEDKRIVGSVFHLFMREYLFWPCLLFRLSSWIRLRMRGGFVVSKRGRKRSCGAHCERADLQVSNFVASTLSEVTRLISFVRQQSSRSNSMDLNTVFPGDVYWTKRESDFSIRSKFTNYDFGITSGENIAKASCWKFGMHYASGPVAKPSCEKPRTFDSFLRRSSTLSNQAQISRKPSNEHLLSPALSSTSWRRGSIHALGIFMFSKFLVLLALLCCALLVRVPISAPCSAFACKSSRRARRLSSALVDVCSHQRRAGVGNPAASCRSW